MVIKIIDSESGEIAYYTECEGCAGLGFIDVEDCEDGVIETCPECDGEGIIAEDNTND